MAERQSKTLFVRNLPFTATNEALTEVFGDVGPVKTAFVVKDKGSDRCRGYGYVKFSMLEDAVKATKEIHKFDGQKIFTSFANAKQREKKKKKEKKGDVTEGTDGESPDRKAASLGESADKLWAPDGAAGKAKASYIQAKTVEVSGLPAGTTMDKLKIIIKDVKCVAQVDFPVESKENAAHLRFKCVRDAKRAVRRLQVLKLHAAQLSKAQHEERGQPKAPERSRDKRGRLIVRNLSFKCAVQDLRSQFEKFGVVTEVTIPTKSDGHPCGFGFVQFSALDAASKAVTTMNSAKIMGRPVAVDWAVAKLKYKADVAPEAVAEDLVKEEETAENSSSEDVTCAPRKRGVKRKADQDDDTDNDSNTDNEDDSDSDDIAESGQNDDAESESADDNMEDDDEDGSNSEEDEDESDDSGSHSRNTLKRQKGAKPERSTDVGEGRTVFVRNVPFEAAEEELIEVFEEFGELAYVRMVLDKQTERPKGTAFVQFRSKESADECLAKGQEEGRNAGISLHGRRLILVLAVSKADAQNRKQVEKTKEKKDSRNLFLAREGMIRAGTQAAVGISQEDMAKRMKVEQAKREKLKNQNIFVSSTRLCIHNLPTKVNETELRKVILNAAAADTAARITECRVMRDMQRMNSSGVGKSLGYAFVNFTQHEHALKALHTLNNSEVFGAKKRPIVEFSLENRRALDAKEKRREKSKTSQKQQEKHSTPAGVGKKPQGKQPSTVSLQKQQDRIARAQHQGPKGLPKHFGPKIRHRDRSKSRDKGRQPHKQPGKDGGGKQKQKKRQKQQPKVQTSKQAKPGVKKARMTDAFDSIVDKYKQKISKGNIKWFES